MKVGYPCVNRTLDCTCSGTLRLASYSDSKLAEKIETNLACLKRILEFNAEKGILFFRISSDLIPFASHEVNDYPWEEKFKDKFTDIGRFIRENHIRISMHPDQFIVLNSKKENVYLRSVRELHYHAGILNLLGLDSTAKFQVHVGGVYGEKEKSKKRFAERYSDLDDDIRERLVIENDDRSYTVRNCLDIHDMTGISVLFDYFHHVLNNDDEDLERILNEVSKTWKNGDGIPMVDYSSQLPGQRTGRHAEHLDSHDFRNFLKKTESYDFDIMLEIKDKERSAMAALEILAEKS